MSQIVYTSFFTFIALEKIFVAGNARMTEKLYEQKRGIVEMAGKMKKSVVDLQDYSGNELRELIMLALDVKKHPEKYSEALKGKTLVMWFENLL